ncbi:MAG: hypothetical protein ACYC2P_01230 [Paludibacteraceae bacterium]
MIHIQLRHGKKSGKMVPVQLRYGIKSGAMIPVRLQYGKKSGAMMPVQLQYGKKSGAIIPVQLRHGKKSGTMILVQLRYGKKSGAINPSGHAVPSSFAQFYRMAKYNRLLCFSVLNCLPDKILIYIVVVQILAERFAMCFRYSLST